MNIQEVQTKKAYVVMQNTDLTEGRGYQRPIAISDSISAAKRIGRKNDTQGTDCQILECRIFRIDNIWYGPCSLVNPTPEDIHADKKLAFREETIKKAMHLGLTQAEIDAITATP